MHLGKHVINQYSQYPASILLKSTSTRYWPDRIDRLKRRRERKDQSLNMIEMGDGA